MLDKMNVSVMYLIGSGHRQEREISDWVFFLPKGMGKNRVTSLHRGNYRLWKCLFKEIGKRNQDKRKVVVSCANCSCVLWLCECMYVCAKCCSYFVQ